MFVSDDDLKLTYGVDFEIGKTLVDRKVPADNLYWKGRYLYIPPMIGYLFIPVYIDLQYRMGISKSVLLSETHLALIEAILHSAAKEEFKLITQDEHIKECLELSAQHGRNQEFVDILTKYFAGNRNSSYWPGSRYKALNRGDAYLFSLAVLDVDTEKLIGLSKIWRSFIDYYLMLDDLEDMEPDQKSGDQNSLLETGPENSITTMNTVLTESYQVLNSINPVLGNKIDYDLHKTKIEAIVATFLQKQLIKKV